MSSDFSLESSQKSTGRKTGDKSNDEDFERFMNDMTESEHSKKLSFNKPKWMQDDDDKDLMQTNRSRTFMKQSKPTPTKTTPGQASSKHVENVEDDEIPRLSLDNSTLSTNRDVDYKPRHLDVHEEEEDDENDNNNNNKEYEDDFSEPASPSRNSNPSVIERKKSNDEVFDEMGRSNDKSHPLDPNSTELLSKVKFMDTLDGNQTAQSQLANRNNRVGGEIKPSLKPHEDIYEDENHNKTTKNNNNSTRTGWMNDPKERAMTTQTRNDLNELAKNYSNFANDDSGLNTLIKANTSSSDPRSTLKTPNKQYYDLVSSRELRSSGKSHSERESTASVDFDTRLGQDVIKAVADELENQLTLEVLNELGKTQRAREGSATRKRTASSSTSSQNMMSKERQAKNAELWAAKRKLNKEKETEATLNNKEWPPKKMIDVASTGYGKTWVSSKAKRVSVVDEFTKIRRASSAKSLSRTGNRLGGGGGGGLDQSLESSRSMNASVTDLQDQLIKCVDENERKLREVRRTHDKQVSELRDKISELSAQLREKSDQLANRAALMENNNKNKQTSNQSGGGDKKRIGELERRLKEQDQLLKGYEVENEKLYADLKQAKERLVHEVRKLEEEKKSLRVGVIQEKLIPNNKTSRSTSPKSPARDTSEPRLVSEASGEFELIKRENAEMRNRLEYYEKHQHQIEQDVKEIESKRDEIKRLKEKIKALESGRTVPEYVRELKRVRAQLKEMDLLVKRLRKTSDPNSGANLSLDYYEKRIESLESQLKERTLDLDRYRRLWEEKYFLMGELDSASDLAAFEMRLADMENGFRQRIGQLEAQNEDLKDAKLKIEVKYAEKQKELVDLKHDFDSYVKRAAFNEARAKSYRPEAFFEDHKESTSSGVDFEYVKRVLEETEKAKIRMVNAENELRLRTREHEFELEKVKSAWQNRLAEANRKHKAEIDKLLNLFTGKQGISNEFMDEFDDDDDDEMSIFNDPIRSRLIKRASERVGSQNDAKLSRLIDTNHQLNAELVSLRERCRQHEQSKSFASEANASEAKLRNVVSFYEEQLKNKNKEIDKFRAELDVMLKVLQSLEAG